MDLPPPPHAPLFKAAAPTYEYVGELYRKIAEGFATIDEKSLFIGPRFAQDAHHWSNPGRFRLFPVNDRASAAAAIDFIVQQGEGTPQNREGSHYNTFLTIYNAFQTEGFPDAVSRKVGANPRTRDSEDAPGQGTTLTDARSVEVAKLFNDVYATSLQTLAQYYSYGGETSKQRECLQLVSRSLMGCAMRPIAEELMSLPASHPATDAKAGPPFELLGPITLPAFVPNRWVTLIEQLESAATRAEALAHTLPRFKHIGENLKIMRVRVERASREGVA